jgi:hypothetical protein
MKTFLIAALFLSVAASAAAECVTTAAGRTICRNAAGQIIATPSGAGAPAAPSTPARGAVVVAPGAAVAPVTATPGGVVGSTTHWGSVTTVQGAAGGRAAYNARTGNAAVSHTNSNGVTTTQTARGGEAKTKNGMGVAQGPGGKTCAKGRGQAKCN